MAKDAKPAQASLTAGPKGHGVVLMAVGSERYQVAYIETEGQNITKFEVPYPGKEDKVDGKPVKGSSIHVALQDLNNIVTKRIREASKLWRR
jgi:hypothetical protein